jgi:hypothetical protein
MKCCDYLQKCCKEDISDCIVSDNVYYVVCENCAEETLKQLLEEYNEESK